MSEAPARVWLTQAVSDWQASNRLLDEGDGASFCQCIGKHQQAVEKAVKSVLAAFRDKRLLRTPTPRGHVVDVEINHILSVVRRLNRSKNTVSLIQHVENLFSVKNLAEISELCSLAPRWPAPGSLFPRNTEYPFQVAATTWTAPAHHSTFSAPELRKFAHLAQKVVAQAGKVVSATEH